MAIGMVIGAVGSVVGSVIAGQGARSAASRAEAGQREANAQYLEATRTNAERQRDWDREMAQDNYEAGVSATELEYSGAVAGLNLQGRALENLRDQTASSYGLQIEQTADLSRMELDNMLRTSAERARIGTFVNVETYKARKAAIQESLRNEKQAAVLRGDTATRKAAEARSQVAREADRASATARVAAGENGAAGTSMYTRMIVANASLEGEQMAMVEGDLSDEFKSINMGLQVAASGARADLQMASLQYEAEAMGIASDVSATQREAALYAQRANAELENLVLQRAFDLEAIDLEGEGLNTQQDQLTERRNLQMEQLTAERDTALDFADFIFDQTITSAEANASAGDALAAAQASASRRTATSSMLAGIAQGGFNILGDYYSGRVASTNARARLIT